MEAVSIERLGKKTLLFLAAEFSLAIWLIYSMFYVASSLGLRYFVLSNRGMVEKTVGGSVLSGFSILRFGELQVFCYLEFMLGLCSQRAQFTFSSLFL